MRPAAVLLAWLLLAGAAQAQSFWAVRSPDAARTADWYRTHLDLTPDAPVQPEGSGLTIIILRGPLAVVEVIQDPAAAAPAGRSTGLFKAGLVVTGLDAWLARWRAAGVTVVAGPFDDPAGRMAVIRDGDGVTLQVLEPGSRR